MIKEFAKMAGNLGGGTTKPNKWKLLAAKAVNEATKTALGLASVLVLSVLGWVFLNALHEIGLITWNPTLWQGIRLIGPPLLLIIAIPFTLNVRIKQ